MNTSLRKYILFIIALLFSNNAFCYNWCTIADSIAKQQMKESPSWCKNTIELYKNTRKSESRVVLFDSIACNGDTIIFLEDFIYMRPTKVTTFWIKNKPSTFSTYALSDYINHDLDRCSYSPGMITLCEVWDTITIRKEEINHPVVYLCPTEKFIMATRLILSDSNKFKIDCIFFRDFYSEHLKKRNTIFNLKENNSRDYLGNNRTVVSHGGSLEQVNHYYPFGAVYSDAGTNDALQRYKYNGKELDRMHGMNLYDYGARSYDPLLCRFTQIDPMAEKYQDVNPYLYCHNSPTNRIDHNGNAHTGSAPLCSLYKHINCPKYQSALAHQRVLYLLLSHGSKRDIKTSKTRCSTQ